MSSSKKVRVPQKLSSQVKSVNKKAIETTRQSLPLSQMMENRTLEKSQSMLRQLPLQGLNDTRLIDQS